MKTNNSKATYLDSSFRRNYLLQYIVPKKSLIWKKEIWKRDDLSPAYRLLPTFLLHKAISNSEAHWSEHLSNTDTGCLYSEMLVGLILYHVPKQLDCFVGFFLFVCFFCFSRIFLGFNFFPYIFFLQAYMERQLSLVSHQWTQGQVRTKKDG